MKTLQTGSFKKTVDAGCAPPGGEWDYNPWAVCNKSTGGPGEGKAKFDRCIQHLKDQNKSKPALDSTKPVGEGQIYTPAIEDEEVKKNRRIKIVRPKPLPREPVSDDEFLRRLQNPAYAGNGAFIIEAKKKERWMQDAVKKPGAFTEYCGGKVTDECVQRGKNSSDKKTRQRANLADTFRDQAKKNKGKKSSSDKKKVEAQLEGRYENIVFAQGDDATEPLNILDKSGEQAALEYLMQWHFPGQHETRDNIGCGAEDYVFKKEAYIMCYSLRLGYIGLVFDTQHNELPELTDTTTELGDNLPPGL